VRALIDIGFRDLRLHRLEAGIEPGNRRSILLARSLGLRKEGLKRRAVFLRDTWVDLGIYAVTCEDVGIPWKGTAKPQPSESSALSDVCLVGVSFGHMPGTSTSRRSTTRFLRRRTPGSRTRR